MSSSAPGADAPPARPPAPRRVREQAYEAVVLMAFSAFTSVALGTALLVISHLGQQG